MRFVDVLVRRGHLSERAIVLAVMVGERPPHLDRCELCAERAVEIGRWLDQVSLAADESLSDAFPAERLAAQHGQILRRLEQLDEPARVIAFPSHFRPMTDVPGSRRVAAAWVGVAAAAGVVLGVIGGQVSARLDQQSTPPDLVVVQAPAPAATTPAAETASAATTAASTAASTSEVDSALIDMDLEGFTPPTLQPINDITPRLVSMTRSGRY
jgi:hypothetical protein